MTDRTDMTEDRNDTLFSRVIDGDATPAEWSEISASARLDPVLWQRLAETIRDGAGFARALRAAVAVADEIDVPAGPGNAPAVFPERIPRRASWTLRAVAWCGWAAAAAIAVAWTANLAPLAPHSARPVPHNTAGVLDGAAAADLLGAYLANGRREQRVIGEVPERVLVDTRPVPAGGGYEVLYLRQILERAVVPDLYEFSAQDEVGRPALVRYEGRPRRVQ